jgi:hypothetical protein
MSYDFSRFKNINDMTDAQRRAWFEAGRPPLGLEPASTMNAETTRAWNAWLCSYTDRLAYELGACSAEIENRLNAKIRGLQAEIGQLRAGLTVERAAKVIDLPNPLKRRRDAA